MQTIDSRLSERFLGIDIYSQSLDGTELYVSVDKLRELLKEQRKIGKLQSHES